MPQGGARVPSWHASLLGTVVADVRGASEFGELSNQRVPAVCCPGESYFGVGYVSYREVGDITPVVVAGGRFWEDADAASGGDGFEFLLDAVEVHAGEVGGVLGAIGEDRLPLWDAAGVLEHVLAGQLCETHSVAVGESMLEWDGRQAWLAEEVLGMQSYGVDRHAYVANVDASVVQHVDLVEPRGP